MRKITTKEFVIRSKRMHGDNYSYSDCKYLGMKKDVIIRCKKHGSFNQRADHHLRGSGCKLCLKQKSISNKKLKAKTFIDKATLKHGDFYDYSFVEYKTSKTKVNIKCPIHGHFLQTPSHHLAGHGCHMCGNKSASIKNKKSFQEFLIEAEKVHKSKFKYLEETYSGMNSNMKIECPEHSFFIQKPRDHLRTHGCQKCGTIEMIRKSDARIYSCSEFVRLAKLIHGDKYSYSSSIYIRSDCKITIECLKHGCFEQIARDHLSGHGCSRCRQSFGERKIYKFLSDANIDFEVQKVFEGCENIRKLKFDFYIERLNLCIEYDGIQHVVGWNAEAESLKYIQKLDGIKNRYCKDNKINLERISHLEINNINVILNKLIKEYYHE